MPENHKIWKPLMIMNPRSMILILLCAIFHFSYYYYYE